jgi:EAL domain-containing protein (putative c-di-GMP-specific phosphodiesterase class I)
VITDKIQEAIRLPFKLDGHELYITASIGIVLDVAGYERPEEVLRDADIAMYQAKAAGKARFEVFNIEMRSQAFSRLEMEQDLRAALENQEFELYYQPIVSGSDCSIYGVEALIRWNDPERGLIGPDDFIPIAEETRLIVPIGDWVLRTACAQAREWMERGMRGVRMAVNLSAYQLEQPDFINRVAVILNETELPPAALELEITESVAMQNAEATIRTLKRLKRMGVRVAVDDFGTGQTSLVYLTRFPVDTLKIDRAFVRDLATDAADAMVVSTVIALGKSLNLHVVGEGVETDEQLDFLRRRGCDAVQGFLFSRPVPALQIERLLEAN